MSRPLAGAALALLCALTCAGCMVGGQLGQVSDPSLTSALSPNTTAELEVTQKTFLLGTIFDLRAARITVSLEMKSLQPQVSLSPAGTPAPTAERSAYLERRVLRLELPVLSFWDLDHQTALGYPGLMEHRHSVDLWLRTGTPDLGLDQGGFAGVGLGWYKTDFLAVTLTADYWSEPAGIEALGANDVLSTFGGEVQGWVFGVELTIAAGEYALDILGALLDMDRQIRDRSWR